MKSLKGFPEKGLSGEVLAEILPAFKSADSDWRQGKIFGFVYHPGREAARIAETYFQSYMYESTMNPSSFPSIVDLEKDIIKMAGEIMHAGKDAGGSMTTGGTESIFLALKTARDISLDKKGPGKKFNVVLPETIHPAFIKACQFLSIEAEIVTVRKDKRADPEAMQQAINENTILLACSAPCFPYGVVDPVTEIGQLAQKSNLLLHVDACMGGFMLPFLEDLGYQLPVFDFRVPGVTSVSMDAHKYGYAPKGSSVILYRKRAHWKKQFFIHTEWPGGIFASTTFMGTKGGGPAAGCWAIMKHLGREGYREIVAEVMKTCVTIKEGIKNLDSLRIISDPEMSVMAFTSINQNIYKIGDALEEKGWHLHRLQSPEALHLTVTRNNVGKEREFLKDLEDVLNSREISTGQKHVIRKKNYYTTWFLSILPSFFLEKLIRMNGKFNKGKQSGNILKNSSVYGMSSTLKNRNHLKKLVEKLLEGIYSPDLS